mgnify:FL=1
MVARWRERDEREAFRVYLSESVRLMAQGKWLKESFLSIVNGGAGDGSEAEDTRSGDEIAAGIIERMGLKVV